jgi:homoserine kinase
VIATAPASSANLGPGFDCLALALDLRCTVRVGPASDWAVDADDRDGRLLHYARSLSADPLAIAITSEIPVGKGLGSSAAVLTALTAAIGAHTHSPLDNDEIFATVAEAEGHPDNAAAAVYGGLVHTAGGRVRRLAMHPSLVPVVAVPDVSLPTPEARAALPASVPLAVASRTASRIALLIEGLRTGDLELLSSVGSDELHEPHRIALRPIIGELMAVARDAGAPHVAISGSGPSVLALMAQDQRSELQAAFQSVESTRVLSPTVAITGVEHQSSVAGSW